MTSVNSAITERVYYQHTNLDQLSTEIIEVSNDESGTFVVFNKTIFHPQGGGQPDDTGYIKAQDQSIPVIKLWCPRDPKEIGVIKHYYDVTESTKNLLFPGAEVTLHIDIEKRKQFARLHSAGHLLSNIVNQIWPEIDGSGGNHFPNQSFVYFSGTSLPANFEKEKVEQALKEAIESKLVCTNNWSSHPRTVQIGSFKPYECGGTHVDNTEELGKVLIRSVKRENKTNRLKVGYDVFF